MHSSERLKGIDVFVTVADLGSFTAAGDRLGLTSSAVSKGIARLERRIGARLFQRTTRRLSLTAEGELFYRTCANVLTELEEAELAVCKTGNELHGRVRIDLPASYGRQHVLPLIMEFTEPYPLLQPIISFTDRLVDPVYEGIDVLIRIGGSDVWSAMLGHRFLGRQKLIFCAAPRYIAENGSPNSVADLDSHSCIGYLQNDGMVSPWSFRGKRPGDLERRQINPRFAIGDGQGEVTAILAGQGIGQLPTWLVHRYVASGEMVEVLPDFSVEEMPINLVWLKSRENMPKVKALVAFLAERLGPEGALVTTVKQTKR